MSAIANKTAIRAGVVIEVMKLFVALAAMSSARAPLGFQGRRKGRHQNATVGKAKA